MIELCGSKGIKREYSNPRTPQQNRVAERKNKTLIEAARTMLAESKLPNMFWTEAVRTACYVLNRVSVTSPHNKTPYDLLTRNIPSATLLDTLQVIKPTGCTMCLQARLVAQGHRQEEGIDYDEVFAPVARIEAIRLFLAFASYMGFLVYQMDVKSSFIYGRIDKEVYVTQPKCFVDPQHSKKVYKVVKALYGIHKAPRAWYATLSTFLLKHGYKRGTIDKTLFLKKNNRDIILVQVYVDDIIFGSTKKAWCDEFEALMKGLFQMSAVGELTFFLGLQVLQRPDAPKPKSKNESDSPVNVHLYRSMIGYLMYLTASKPDIMFAVSACLRHQVTPTTSNLEAVKKSFKYLKGQPKLGLWYPKKSPLVLEAYSDSDYAGANKDQKSTTGVPSGIAKVPAGYFWSTATLKAPELGPPAILATIDKTPYTITEELVRSRLHLADDGGIADLPIPNIYSGMDNLGYVTEGKLTFFKNKFSSQWRFLVHTILHRLSTKSGSWDQFGSPIAIALICLSDGRRFNWSNYIFRGMVSNIENAKKFLMYPRFLQTILAFFSKLFANMRLNFARHPMPLLPTMILQAQAGGGAEVAEQAVPHLMPSPDHSSAPLPTPSRPPTSDHVASVLEHDHSSDPHETVAGPFPSREDTTLRGDFHTSPPRSSHAPPVGQPSGDTTLRGDFHTSPPRSSHAPPVGQPSGGTKDPITLTALSFVVSTLVQKVHSLEAELHDHKKLFKDVVGKLVKKVKTLEVKLKTKKRKIVVSDSDQKDGTTQNVDLDALRALANAAVAADSDIPSGSTSQIPAASTSVPTAGPSDTSGVPPPTFAIPPGASDALTGASTDLPGASNVSAAASAVLADSPNVPAAVLADSPNVPAGVSNKGKSLMVDEDITVKAMTFRQMEDDRLGKKAAKRLHEEEMAHMESERAEAQRKRQQEIRKVQSHSQIQAFSRTLKRPGPVLKEPSTKRPKSPNAPTPSMPAVPISPTVTSPPSSRTRRKSLGRKHMHKPKSTLLTLDLDAPAQTFLKVVVDEDSDDVDFVDEGKGFLCLAKSTSVGDTKLAVVHSFKCSCVGGSFW
nr:putative ribonuclease H-like domain-containing protein [Tanacetum cinerariifolium]